MVAGIVGVAIVAGLLGSIGVVLAGGGFLAAFGVYALTGTVVLVLIVLANMVLPQPAPLALADAREPV